jgi:hypothetical protein
LEGLKLLTAGAVAGAAAFVSIAAGAQTVTRSNVATEVHSSIPVTGQKEWRYKEQFDKWVLHLPAIPKVKAEMDALARLPYKVSSDNSAHAELVFDANDAPQLLKGEERLFMFINRYDEGLKNTADQLAFVIEKYPDASGAEKKYIFKANAVYNFKTGKFERRIDR